jgi:hypothetical protein
MSYVCTVVCAGEDDGGYIPSWAFVFSLKRFKTYLKNTMEQSRLNGLTLMNIHQNIPLSTEQIINEFSV